jgi:hypothetical protein
MREISDPELKARRSIDDEGRIRYLNYVDSPQESSSGTPFQAAIDYVRQTAAALNLSETDLRNLHQKVSFDEPRQQGMEYRFGQEKTLLDSTTIIFNQTFLNVPVWRAAITVTLKNNPSRVLTATDTSEQGVNATLPPQAKIDAHRKLFFSAAGELEQHKKAQARQAVGEGEIPEQSATAAFIRSIVGRTLAAGETAPNDEARAIRGRFFVYRYQYSTRVPAHATEGAAPETPFETPPPGDSHREALPILKLPPVSPVVTDGAWRVVSEVTFSLHTTEFGPLNWRALVDVETDSVLMLEPLVAGHHGMVFRRDPITSTGVATNGPNQPNSVLNALRTTLELPNLDAPNNGNAVLRGRFAIVADVNAPTIAPPTKPTGQNFDYDARTNDFAAVNAYYHTDRFFALVEDLGFPIAQYFDHTTFPVRVDHRDNLNLGQDTINAWCVGNGSGGIGFAGYALNDLSDTTNPIGRACDSRVHLHELGGHGILYEHVDHANFGFAHSAGDSLSAILHDPDSMLRNDSQQRFRYAPWNPSNTRRFDRRVTDGFAWGGTQDDKGYGSEQILCTTMFRVYRAIGGDSSDLNQRRFASRMVMYLILRAISTLTPATNPRNALGFANALMAVDLLNWASESVFGGAYGKVVRWSFEKQGLYQAPGAPTPVSREGQPPDVDVYIDDGRGGEYAYQATYWDNRAIWNRRAADGVATHQEPIAGVPNFAYVRVKNRGTQIARNCRVRAYHRRAGAARAWPDGFEPVTTTELVVGTVNARNTEEKVVGPFTWVPNADSSHQDCLLMIVSADGDASNVQHVTTGESIEEWRLVPNDNNLGLRNLAPGSADAERASTALAEPAPRLSLLGTSTPSGSSTSTADQRFLRSAGFTGEIPANARVSRIRFEVAIDDLSSVGDVVEARTIGNYDAVAPHVLRAARLRELAEAEFGMRRHAIIGAAAMERVKSANARSAIARILDEGGEPSLADAAKWADELRDKKSPPSDPATQRFLGDRRNKGFSKWHFVNLPLELPGYDRERHPEFTRKDDIVQTILLCLDSLERPGRRARFEEITALRWLSHLIGDLHQPVHVGCGFIANAKTNNARLVFAPEQAVALPHDSGGNALVLPIGGNLHSFWDSKLGPDLIPNPLELESDAALIAKLSAAPSPSVTGEAQDIRQRITSWANDTLRAAGDAYSGIRIVSFSGDNYRVEWEGEAAYRQRCAPIVSARMLAAATNLATVLDSIWP